MNVSVEKRDDGLNGLASPSTEAAASGTMIAAAAAATGGKLSGYIRIRSKTQGIALSLGDRITVVQRTATPVPGSTTGAAVAMP